MWQSEQKRHAVSDSWWNHLQNMTRRTADKWKGIVPIEDKDYKNITSNKDDDHVELPKTRLYYNGSHTLVGSRVLVPTSINSIIRVKYVSVYGF